MQSINSSDDDADADAEFNNRALDVDEYNLEELNLNISLDSGQSRRSNNPNEGCLLKSGAGTDSDQDDCPVIIEDDLAGPGDGEKPIELLGSSNMDIQTARGPDAPDDAYLDEDSIEQTAEHLGGYFNAEDVNGEERKVGQRGGLVCSSIDQRIGD